MAQKPSTHEISHSLGLNTSHCDSSKLLPQLAPGPLPIFSAQSSMATRRPKKNPTACLACKAAKRKASGLSPDTSCECSGLPSPCKACLNAGSEDECQFHPSRDLRRKVAVKRTIQELSDYKDLFDSLLSTIRLANTDQLSEVTAIIRNNVPMKGHSSCRGKSRDKLSRFKNLIYQ
ncbi:hypothetical protein N7509_000066 [Penicillium cosmopolitanum]|uniref:Zn(2)-C6 fungal-type domain-containing protein n=1 Tax=Penicillium cosmopolitanum TaxID=1131564 RepID=A0A9W9WCR5_9EURO|nr:uncharacterized protein N7509_000066 [Penicillium cosmopolitanum]KAJ5414968.1 hypothetical protein N7509_000066 [Penicillium cosmopolitanum]